MARFIVIMMPKETGSTPQDFAIGSKIGVKMIVAGMLSMKQPIISRKMFISRSRKIRLLVRLRIALGRKKGHFFFSEEMSFSGQVSSLLTRYSFLPLI